MNTATAMPFSLPPPDIHVRIVLRNGVEFVGHPVETHTTAEGATYVISSSMSTVQILEAEIAALQAWPASSAWIHCDRCQQIEGHPLSRSDA